MTVFIQLTIGLLLVASICRYYNITRLIWKVLDYIYFVVLAILFINTPIVFAYGKPYAITQYLTEHYPDHAATYLWCIVFMYSYLRLIVDTSRVIAMGISECFKGRSR